MTPIEYEPVQQRIKALTWPEASPEDLENLLGGEHVRVHGNGVQVRNSDGTWVLLEDGWHVAVTGSNIRIVIAPAAFAALYRPVT
jgi:hypothetical protein